MAPTLRGLSIVGILLGLHLFQADAMESLRLRGLSVLAPAIFFRGSADPEVPPTRLSALAREEEIARARAADPELALFPAVDSDLARGRCFLAGGRAEGVQRGAAVFYLGDRLGTVDAVEQGVSRLRLLTAAGSRVAVTIEPRDRSLPAGLSRLSGVLVGDGRTARVTGSFLPDVLRAGDEVSAADDAGVPRRVGRLANDSAEPLVDLYAEPLSAAFVAVDGVPFRDEPPDAFVRVGASRLLEAYGPVSQVLLRTSESGILPGCGVISQDRLLGLVRHATGDLVTVDPDLDPPGDRSVVLAHERGRFERVTVRRLQRSRHQVLRPTEPTSGPCIVLTGGGDLFVPPFLERGRGSVEGATLLLLEEPRAWTVGASISVFPAWEAWRRLGR